MPDMEQSVREHIEASRDELVEFLKRLVREQSVTGNERPAQEVVIDEFEAMGLNPDVWEPNVGELRDHPGFFETRSFQKQGYEGRPNVAAVVEGSGDGQSLAFSGHIDVVSPEPVDEWTHGPWNPVVEDGKLYGRGSGDMKGGVAAFVFAAKALLELDVDLAGDLVLQTTIDEEDGGVGGVLSALERGYRPDAAVIPEPYHVPNIAIASAGVLNFRVRVPGKSAHAARDYLGESAVFKAISICEALDELDRERKTRIEYAPATRLDPDAEGNVTSINIGVFESGDWPSTVPGEALLEGRVGWPPGESREEIRTQIEDAISAVVENDEWLSEHPPEVEWFGMSAEPHETDPDAEIVQIATRRCEDVTGDAGEFIGGTAGLDERFYVNYYDIPCPSVGPKGYYPHGVDEYVRVDSVVETAQVLALTAIDWCGQAE
jgi:acetylornithine deacetylase